MKRLCVVMLLALGGSGCFAGSVHPILAPGDRLDVPAAVGKWRNTGNTEKSEVTLEVTALPEKLYSVVLKDGAEAHPVKFVVAAGKLGAHLWLDAQVDREDPGFVGYRDWVYRPHLSARVAVEEDTLKVWFINEKWFEEQQKKGKVKLAFIPRAEEHGLILFTAPTPALQKALKSLEKEKDALGDPSVFARVKSGG